MLAPNAIVNNSHLLAMLLTQEVALVASPLAEDVTASVYPALYSISTPTWNGLLNTGVSRSNMISVGSLLAMSSAICFIRTSFRSITDPGLLCGPRAFHTVTNTLASSFVDVNWLNR